MKEVLNKIKEGIVDILLPRTCVACGKEGNYICNECELFLNEAPNDTENLVTVFEYEGVIERLIKKIKHEGLYHAVDELVEKAFAVIFRDITRFQPFLEFLLNPDTHITYVPMSKKKEKQRGFNQAELIAKRLGEITKKEAVPLLLKIKDNRSQAGLDPRERIENVRDSFKFSGLFFPKKVVLVDDFYASGATTKECMRVLRQNGVEDVWRFILAKSDH